LKALLVNPNSFQPAVPPIGLEYICEALMREADCALELFDFGIHRGPDLEREIRRQQPEVIGLSLRNIDTAQMFNSREFVSDLAKLVTDIRQWTTATIVLGGSGFSMMPREIMRRTGADFGVVGEGERVLPMLLRNMDSPEKVPNLYMRQPDGSIATTRRQWFSLAELPTYERRLVDFDAYHATYSRYGDNTICAVQTKRGCNKRCIYCTEPQVIGSQLRLRPTQKVIEELRCLHARGVRDRLFMADSEFNVSNDHAIEVSEAIAASGLPVSWSCYMTPEGASEELIVAVRRAGCSMVFWSMESACDRILHNLGKGYGAEDVVRSAAWCRKHEQPYTILLMFGGPGETTETIDETYANIERCRDGRIGVVTGVRVYAGTQLAALATHEGDISANHDLLQPTFYRERFTRESLYPHVARTFSRLDGCMVLGPTRRTRYDSISEPLTGQD
jgi:radical SAM superfamily enzyme YgiQ (UPF0313 family)